MPQDYGTLASEHSNIFWASIISQQTYIPYLSAPVWNSLLFLMIFLFVIWGSAIFLRHRSNKFLSAALYGQRVVRYDNLGYHLHHIPFLTQSQISAILLAEARVKSPLKRIDSISLVPHIDAESARIDRIDINKNQQLESGIPTSSLDFRFRPNITIHNSPEIPDGSSSPYYVATQIFWGVNVLSYQSFIAELAVLQGVIRQLGSKNPPLKIHDLMKKAFHPKSHYYPTLSLINILFGKSPITIPPHIMKSQSRNRSFIVPATTTNNFPFPTKGYISNSPIFITNQLKSELPPEKFTSPPISRLQKTPWQIRRNKTVYKSIVVTWAFQPGIDSISLPISSSGIPQSLVELSLFTFNDRSKTRKLRKSKTKATRSKSKSSSTLSENDENHQLTDPDSDHEDQNPSDGPENDSDSPNQNQIETPTPTETETPDIQTTDMAETDASDSSLATTDSLENLLQQLESHTPHLHESLQLPGLPPGGVIDRLPLRPNVPLRFANMLPQDSISSASPSAAESIVPSSASQSEYGVTSPISFEPDNTTTAIDTTKTIPDSTPDDDGNDTTASFQYLLQKQICVTPWAQPSEIHHVFGYDNSTPRDDDDDDEDRNTCSICLTDPISILILPCRHFVVCEECFQQIQKCPICREPIRGHVILRISSIK